MLTFAGHPDRAAAQSGGIDVFIGEALFFQGTRVSLGYVYEHDSGATGLAAESTGDVDRQTLALGATYGAFPGGAISVLVPHIRRTASDATRDYSAEGIGDASILLKVRVLQRHGIRKALNASATVGLEMPTGGTDETWLDAPAPPHLQIGSGSWDPVLSLGATAENALFKLDGIGLYKRNTTGSRDYKSGDVFSGSLTAAWRILQPKMYPGASANVKAGLRVRWEGRSKASDGVRGREKTDLFVRFGATYHPIPEWDVVAGVEIPFHHSPSEQSREVRSRISVALGYRFIH